MPDQKPTLADRLAADLGTVRWPTGQEIRTRARRRTLITMTVAPVAILLVLAGAWAVTTVVRPDPAGRPGLPLAEPMTSEAPAPVATPAPPRPRGTQHRATPSRTSVRPGTSEWIPPEALLQPADRGTGFRSQNENTFGPGEHPAWTFNFGGACPAYPGLNVTAYRRYLFIRVHTVEQAAGAGGEPPVFVETTRFPGEMAGQVLADTRRVITACASFTAPPEAAVAPPAAALHRWALLADDFVGDESLLLQQRVVPIAADTREETGESQVSLYAVVRVGDLVAVLRADHDDPDWMREIARRAASRLCRTGLSGSGGPGSRRDGC